MPIKPLNDHYSITTPASVYDEDALTALELAGRTTAKVNETVKAFNDLEESIPGKIAADVEKHIANGEFDEQIDKSIGNLTDRVDNMLGSMTEGSTTMDAEIIDARLGQDGTNYANVGTAIRTQLTKSLMLKKPTVMDADQITEPGFYFRASGEAWNNTPGNVGTLLVIGGGVGTSRVQQIFITYYSGFHIREYNGAAFTAWRDIDLRTALNTLENKALTINNANGTYDANTLDYFGCIVVRNTDGWSNLPALAVQSGLFLNLLDPTGYFVYQLYFHFEGGLYLRHKIPGAVDFTEWQNLTSPIKSTLPDGTDLDTVNITGVHFIAGSNNYENLPEANSGGMLDVKYESTSRWYQTYISAASTGYYFRNFVNGSWKPWKRLIVDGEIPSGGGGSETSGKEYFIEKKDNKTCYIYKRGVKGLIRYEYGHHIDTTINLDVWRLLSTAYCDFDRTVIKTISDAGADLEGVVLLEEDQSDHVGGVHGDEIMLSSLLIINGKPYTFDTVDSMEADTVEIFVMSNIYSVGGNSSRFLKTKHIIFDNNGVTMNLRWSALEFGITVKSARAGMMSVNKDLITHVYYPCKMWNYQPVSPSAIDTQEIADLTDVYYYGNDVSIHHWIENRSGSTSAQTGFIADYGTRLKSYFTCANNTSFGMDEEFTATNHIKITC